MRTASLVLFCLFVVCGQVDGLSLRSRTGALLRRARVRVSSPFSSNTRNCAKQKKTLQDAQEQQVPFGYAQTFGGGNNHQQTPYVPSGLTAAEYARIRAAEAAAVANKNFGAWGPRFARSDRPDGDWLLLPNLWTTGAPNAYLPTSSYKNDKATLPSSPLRWFILVRQLVSDLVLSFLAVHVLWTAVHLARHAGQLTVKQALWRAVCLLVEGKQYLVQAYATTIMMRKVYMSAALTLPLHTLLNTWQTKKGQQLSRLRLVGLSVVASLIGLASYAVLIVVLQKVFS